MTDVDTGLPPGLWRKLGTDQPLTAEDWVAVERLLKSDDVLCRQTLNGLLSERTDLPPTISVVSADLADWQERMDDAREIVLQMMARRT